MPLGINQANRHMSLFFHLSFDLNLKPTHEFSLISMPQQLPIFTLLRTTRPPSWVCMLSRTPMDYFANYHGAHGVVIIQSYHPVIKMGNT